MTDNNRIKMFNNKNVTQILYLMTAFCLCVFTRITDCRRAKRIVGGEEVACGTQLRVASLRNSSNSYHLCGVTVLSYNFAVTAAHCVENEPKHYYIQFNNYCLGLQDVPKTPVLNVTKHDFYKKFSHVHDIAVLRIKFNFTDMTPFNGIILPDSSFGISGKCTIYGYGYRDVENKRTTETLYSAEVKLISLDECTSSLGPYIAPKADSGMICAIGDGVDTCQGDSGGPLLCSEFLQGLTSYGLDCNISEKPGVYVSIGAHIEWLRHYINDE